jgi:hypothetical protein
VKSPPPDHPAEYSPEVLAVIELLLVRLAPAHVHDPFAGRGARLGPLCDRLAITYSGTDIEQYDNADPRVLIMNAADPTGYPKKPFATVTSPVYLGNRISSDYVNGPTPRTKRNGRGAYGISLGRALHADNFARVCRPGDEAAYYAGHGRVVKHWGEHAIVNVDLPIRDGWIALLLAYGYVIDDVHPVHTRRYRGPANSERRAEHEVVIVATRGEVTP